MNLLKPFCGLAAIVGFTFVGCGEVDYGDVQSKRDNVQEERRETAETRREVAENIHEEEAETADAIRHEAMKPIASDEVREEISETEEDRRAGAEAIAEEEKETREAQQDLAKTEAQFSAQRSRDAFVKQTEATLEVAQKQIDALEEKAVQQEGPAKAETEGQIAKLTTHRDLVKDQLSELKAEEVLGWESHREQVQRALSDLERELNELK